MSGIPERIGLLITKLGISKNQFSKEIGTSSALISQIVSNGKESFRIDLIQKIVIKYPNVNLYWLLLGEGEMMIPTRDIRNDDLDQLIRNREDEILFVHAKLIHIVELLTFRFNVKPDKAVAYMIKETISEMPYIELSNTTFSQKLNHLDQINKMYKNLISTFWRLFGEFHLRERKEP